MEGTGFLVARLPTVSTTFPVSDVEVPRSRKQVLDREATLLFPYIESFDGKRIPNEHIATWAEDWRTVDARLAKYDLRGPALSQLLPVLSSVPVTLIDQRTGNAHSLRFVAGMLGVVEDEVTGAIAPEIGWAVVHGLETGKKWNDEWNDELEPVLDEDGDEIDQVTGLKKRE